MHKFSFWIFKLKKLLFTTLFSLFRVFSYSFFKSISYQQALIRVGRSIGKNFRVSLINKRTAFFSWFVILSSTATLITLIYCSSFPIGRQALWISVIYKDQSYQVVAISLDTPQSVIKYLKPGSRIVAVDQVPIQTLVSNGSVYGKLLSYKVLFYKTQVDPYPGPEIKSIPLDPPEAFLVTSIKAKSFTVDTSKLTQNTSTALTTKEDFGSSPVFIQSSSSSRLQEISVSQLTGNWFNPISIAFYLALMSFCFWAGGLFLYVLKPGQSVTFIFSQFCNGLSLAIVISTSVNYHPGLVERVATVLSVGTMAVLFFHFVLLFPDGDKINNQFLAFFLKAVYFLSVPYLVVWLYLVSITFIVSDPSAAIAENTLRKTNAFIFVLLFTISLGLLIRKFWSAKGQARLRLNLAVFSIVFALLPIALIGIMYTVFNWWEYLLTNYLALVFMPSTLLPPLFIYAVVKNELIGVNIFLRRIIEYAVLSSIVVLVYLFVSTVLTSQLTLLPESEQGLSLLTALLIALLLGVTGRLRVIVQKFLNRIFKLDPLDFGKLSHDWSERLVKFEEPTKLLSTIVDGIPQDYHYSHAQLLITDSEFLEFLTTSIDVNQQAYLANTSTTDHSSPAANSGLALLIATGNKVLDEVNKKGKYELVSSSSSASVAADLSSLSHTLLNPTTTLIPDNQTIDFNPSPFSAADSSSSINYMREPGAGISKNVSDVITTSASHYAVDPGSNSFTNRSSSSSSNVSVIDEANLSYQKLELSDLDLSLLWGQFLPSPASASPSAYVFLDAGVDELNSEPSFLASYEPLSFLKNLNTHLIFPLWVGSDLYGFLLLGQKTNDYLPTREELAHLSTIASQISLALHNSLSLGKSVQLAREASELAQAQQELRQSLEHLVDYTQGVREEERVRLAEDLHDDIIQDVVFLVRNIAQHNTDWLDHQPAEMIEEAYNKNKQLLNKVLEKLRTLNFDLNPFPHGTFTARLAMLVAYFQSQNPRTEIKFMVQGLDDIGTIVDELIPVDLSETLLRIVREAVVNAIKHAQSSRIEVIIEGQDAGLEEEFMTEFPNSTNTCEQLVPEPENDYYEFKLKIRDNGIGFDFTALNNFNSLILNHHFGLSSLVRRMEKFKQTYNAQISFASGRADENDLVNHSRPGFQVVVDLRLPFTSLQTTSKDLDEEILRLHQRLSSIVNN